MAIINGNKSSRKEKIKAEISCETYQTIQQYCQWANIDNIGFFIEEAAHFIFAKDKDWKQHQKSSKKSSQNA